MANTLDWKEVRSKLTEFSKRWADAKSESGEKQSFWNEFFKVYNQDFKKVGRYENPALKTTGTTGAIDFFWPKKLLIEHKSLGKDLDKAYEQACGYLPHIPQKEKPEYVIVSDFRRIRVYEHDRYDDTKAGKLVTEVELDKLPEKADHFAFLAGYPRQASEDQPPVNFAATKLLAGLHNALEAQNYKGEDLEILMVRIAFCLFAEDTGIFRLEQFRDYLYKHTETDGSDLGAKLIELFGVLNKPLENRQTNIHQDLQNFDYVNGSLFEKLISTPCFSKEGRDKLLECVDFNWAPISPAIFGSLFQNLLDEDERRESGAHYTSEKNIMKVISALFLDDLKAELGSIKSNPTKLKIFHNKLKSLRFLDPACGSGNFLIIAYRELRKLEIEVLKLTEDLSKNFALFNILELSQVTVSQFYGIEIKESAVKVAETALWMMDHQMNVELGRAFGGYAARLPLGKRPQIKWGNALQIDWEEVVPKKTLSYILGNPPFRGSRWFTQEQRRDFDLVSKKYKGSSSLDFVCAWFLKAAYFVKDTKISVGFVATNSISQGDQVNALWGEMYKVGMKIHFAHRSFRWFNDASGNAAVIVVIIGFANFNTTTKRLFDYQNSKGDPIEFKANNISPYLIDGSDFTIGFRSKPICDVLEMNWGSMPNEGQLLLFTEKEMFEFIIQEPKSEKWFRRIVGSYELINNELRYCLWLENCSPQELKSMPLVMERIEKVRNHRLKSTRDATRKLSSTPWLFGERRHTSKQYLAVPEVSSQNRNYIPLAFLPPEVIASNKIQMIPEATNWHFGVLTSKMHMTWMRYVTGRLKNDFSYSNTIVYNNFPWPEAPKAEQRSKVEEKAQAVLDARANHPTSSLAALYDPRIMPIDLQKAHQALDKAVDACYGKSKFATERERMELLFELYQRYTAPLLPAVKQQKARRKKV